MNQIKHGSITIIKITDKTWVAKVVTYEIMRAEIEMKGTTEYNAFYKLMNFIESVEMPCKIETLPNGNKLYHFKS